MFWPLPERYGSEKRAYFKVSDAEISDNMRLNFPQSILTLMSVVLGVALSILAGNVVKIQTLEGPLLLLRAAEILFVFFLIVGMFHMYNYYTAILFSPPTFLNTFPLLLVGACLIYLAGATSYGIETLPCKPGDDAKNNISFLIGLTAFHTAASVVCSNTLRVLKRNIHNNKTGKHIAEEVRKNQKFFTGLSIISAIYLLIVTLPSGYANPMADVIFMVLNFSALVVCVFITRHRFLEPLFSDLFPDEPPASGLTENDGGKGPPSPAG